MEVLVSGKVEGQMDNRVIRVRNLRKLVRVKEMKHRDGPKRRWHVGGQQDEFVVFHAEREI